MSTALAIVTLSNFVLGTGFHLNGGRPSREAVVAYSAVRVTLGFLTVALAVLTLA